MIQRTRDEVIRVSGSTHISVTPAEVWALIKPAEAAMFLEPTVVKAFQVPGTPKGVGEMQGFISHREGLEHIHLIEIVEEIPEQLAVIRQVGSNDPSARTTYRLTSDSTGTNLELEQALTVQAVHARSAASIREQHQLAAVTLLSRVKYILEQDHSPRRGRHA